MSLQDQGIFVRFISLPKGIKGVTIPNNDETFDIYINANLSDLARRTALVHELRHIKLNHFYKPYEAIAVEELAANM